MLDFDPLQGFHEGDQKMNPILRTLQFCQHIAVFEIPAETGQTQPFCQFIRFQAESNLLNAAGEPNTEPADDGFGRKSGKDCSLRLISDIVVP